MKKLSNDVIALNKKIRQLEGRVQILKSELDFERQRGNMYFNHYVSVVRQFGKIWDRYWANPMEKHEYDLNFEYDKAFRNGWDDRLTSVQKAARFLHNFYYYRCSPAKGVRTTFNELMRLGIVTPLDTEILSNIYERDYVMMLRRNNLDYTKQFEDKDAD